MSLKDLSNNIQQEAEYHTFVKYERVIRRTLNLQHVHEEMSNIIRSHKHEEERKSNVKACMTNYFLHSIVGAPSIEKMILLYLIPTALHCGRGFII